MHCGGVYKELSAATLIWPLSSLSRVLHGFETEMSCGHSLWSVKLAPNKITKF